MLVIWGSRFYGKIDRWPGAFYVVTKFAHINFVPLIPLESWLVFEGTENGKQFRGFKLPGLSLKSVLLGYLRAALVVAAVVLLVGGAVQAQTSMAVGLPWLGMGAGACALIWATYLVGRATPERVRELSRKAGFSPAMTEAVLAGRGWKGALQVGAEASAAAKAAMQAREAAARPATAATPRPALAVSPKPATPRFDMPVAPARSVAPVVQVPPAAPPPAAEPVTMEMIEALPFVEEEKT